MNIKDLDLYGIENTKELVYNPDYEQLYRDELQNGLQGYEAGQLTELGAVSVLTGIYTGRSPKDKYIVDDDITKDTIWWNSDRFPNDNRPIQKDTWKALKDNTISQLSGKKLYVVDTYCGTNSDSRIKVRFITEVAWQAHFVKNMFLRPDDAELVQFGEPDFVVLNASKAHFKAWKDYDLHSEIYTAFNLSERMQVVGGTWYGGEMKKGIFAMMNYYLPLKGIAAMHCSANRGENGDVAVFFGLSGTGKTTLSTDPKRALIGDDEHGWDQDGVFNFEGGCYAKTIDLDEQKEPEIYQAIKKHALLENVVVDAQGRIDFHDSSITQNARVSYPIYHIENIVRPVSRAGHANKVIFLSADAYGVLPPVSKLDSIQTQYHFLSGFTAKVAGTERGVDEPEPTFSACFGEAFLTLHPIVYAHELVKKMEEHGAQAYLVNTGWNGSGKRISLQDTRGIIDAILNGEIEQAPTKKIPVFNLEIPVSVPGVDPGILDPRDTYSDRQKWDEKASYLARLFISNFVKYTDTEEGRALTAGGPKQD